MDPFIVEMIYKDLNGNTDLTEKEWQKICEPPWSMVTDNRIFSRNFAIYGRMHAVFSLQTVVKHRPGLR